MKTNFIKSKRIIFIAIVAIIATIFLVSCGNGNTEVPDVGTPPVEAPVIEQPTEPTPTPEVVEPTPEPESENQVQELIDRAEKLYGEVVDKLTNAAEIYGEENLVVVAFIHDYRKIRGHLDYLDGIRRQPYEDMDEGVREEIEAFFDELDTIVPQIIEFREEVLSLDLAREDTAKIFAFRNTFDEPTTDFEHLIRHYLFMR